MSLSHAIENTAPDAPSWASRLPKLLRTLGASAVLFSLYTFLFKGWEGSTDLIRYVMLLAHTCLLAAFALGSAHFFREGKGPRLLMMLALVSVPINFAILGAFIASGSDVASQSAIPSFVFWSIDSLSTALATTVVATLLLTPVIILAFRSLARSLSKPMSILFIAANLMLLLPIRDALFASAVPMLVAVITLFFSAKTARERTESKTFDGMIALLLMFLPSGIMLGRELWLHHQDSFMIATAALMVCIVLRHLWFVVREFTFFRVLCEGFGLLATLVAGTSIGESLLATSMGFGLASSIAALTTAALMYEISTRASPLKDLYRFIAFITLLLVHGVSLIFFEGLAVAIFSMILGAALIIASHVVQARSILFAGIALLLAGALVQAINLVTFFDFSYWPVLAGGGIAAIVLASLIESRGLQLKQRVGQYRNDYAQWAF